MKVQTAQLKNIHDKEQLYLILGEGDTLSGTKVIINIGQKTYDAVNKLLTPQQDQKNKKEITK